MGGAGILRDQGGNDEYDFYMPAPLIPGTPNEQPGVGNQGTPVRGNHVTIGPDPTCQNSTCSGGVFMDR